MYSGTGTKLGPFREGTRGKAVPIVEKLQERMETEFVLLKFLRTHYWRHWEPFSGQKYSIDSPILHIQFQNFSDAISRTLAETARCLDPDTNFRYGAVPAVDS